MKKWQKFFIVVCGIGFLCSFMLIIPFTQERILDFGEKLLHRPLTRSIWIWRMTKNCLKLELLFSAIIFGLLSWNNKKASFKITAGIFVAVSVFMLIIAAPLLKYKFDYMFGMWLYAFFIFAAFFLINPNNGFHSKSWENASIKEKKISTGIFLTVCILMLILPMAENSVHENSIRRGDIEREREECENQYEEMAEAILGGHLYIDNGDVSKKLLEMKNPYDPIERENAGLIKNIDYKWDHAFYNNHYYMYFGVAPVFLLFIPYRAIFNSSLTTYHATQIFTSLAVAGIFALLYVFASRYGKRISWAAYLLLSASLSIASVWYFMVQPPLYCTAISSGVCFAIWGFVLVFQALMLDDEKSKGHNLKLFFGALCSALVFACRPPVGMLCLAYVPMIINYVIKNKSRMLKIIQSATIFCIPFIVVATLLMVYNYARFDNPFEFGQTYQITSADQINITKDFFGNNIFKIAGKILGTLTIYRSIEGFVPIYLGPIILFPIFITIFSLFNKKGYKQLKDNDLSYINIVLFITIILIVILQVMWSPFIIVRYTMDYTFIFCILTMIVFCMKFQSVKDDVSLQSVSFKTCLLCLYTIIVPFFIN